MTDHLTIAVYSNQAETYADMVSKGEPDADLQSFIDAIPANGRVLDLGCGPGNSAAMMRDAGLQVDATDACPQMIELAEKRHGIIARLESFAQLDSIACYDGIWANFSLLHAKRDDMPEHLSQIHRALHPHGYFHIGMKLGTGAKRDRLNRFYTYYSEAELTDLLEQHGFSPLYKRQGEGKALSGEIAPFIIIQSRKTDD
ncbi:class I SAM-dependent DNA methyltransferase [Pseudaestuariivita rosea]|uniref:class I SAM-dependent DNA methyltransferase n=1 Tax=Pseudaestuariivita rosea TaxID=2763263 RepID=UPI001ABA5A9E|nr:class I SAM-dependent methyltransferase [Pseudaestuariivita rosea]